MSQPDFTRLRRYIARIVVRRCMQLDITQEDLALVSGVSIHRIKYMYSGGVRFTVDDVGRVLQALDMSLKIESWETPEHFTLDFNPRKEIMDDSKRSPEGIVEGNSLQ